MELNEQSNLILKVTDYVVKHEKVSLFELRGALTLSDRDYSFLETILTNKTQQSLQLR